MVDNAGGGPQLIKLYWGVRPSIIHTSMSSCSVCGDHHKTMTCPELYGEIRPLKDPQPTGPRGQDDEDDAVAASENPASLIRCSHLQTAEPAPAKAKRARRARRPL